MYPLGLSLLGDGLAPGILARAYTWYLAMECIGSQVGAAAMGRARDLWGEAAMFIVGAVALVAVLLTWAGSRLLHEERSETQANDRRAA
jgi:predicted MFS family arabinose efflux permease